MFFRDEHKETMVALKLTQELEMALKNQRASGNSLSDMIKSFEQLEEDDFEEPYEYRAYKRALLDGRYNPLRWVAHERNQVMHQNRYFITHYSKFKYTIKDAIKYIKSGRSQKMTLESNLLGLFKALPYLIPLGFLLVLFQDKIFSANINIVFLLIGSIFAFGIAMRFGELLATFLELLYTLYDHAQKIATNHKLLFFGLVLSYLFWGKDLSSLPLILQHIKELF